jgi:general secretion pathway protein E
MTSPLQERMRIDGQDRTTLLAAAHRLAAAGGGLPAVMAGLQAEFGLGEEAAGELAAAAFGISAISLAEMSGHSLALTLAPFAEFVRRQALVLEVGEAYLIATPNPFDAVLRDWLEGLVPLGKPLLWRVAAPSVLAAYLAREESQVRALDGSLSGEGGQIAIGSLAEDLSLQRISEDGSAIVRLVRSKRHPPRIAARRPGHQVPHRRRARASARSSAADLAEQAISRIKVMAELDIAERRVPQDGRFKVRRAGARSTSASPSCPASTARTRCCACSTRST